MNDHPAVGWVRGDNVPDETAALTINSLRSEIDGLRGQLDRLSKEPPKGTESLAQGQDTFIINFTTRPLRAYPKTVETSPI